MKPDELKRTLQEKLSYLSFHYNQLQTAFNYEGLKSFKNELRTIRSFMKLVRLNNGDNQDLKMSLQCKRLYNIASLYIDAQHEINRHAKEKTLSPSKFTELNQYLLKAKAEWEKSYMQSILPKLEAQLLQYHYGRIPAAVLDNFFSRHITGQQPSRSAQQSYPYHEA